LVLLYFWPGDDRITTTTTVTTVPGEDKNGDRIADQTKEADTVEEDPRDPELEDGVVHLVGRWVLNKGGDNLRTHDD
jgi:hypothetical protein